MPPPDQAASSAPAEYATLQTLRPLTMELVAAVLRADEYSYGTDGDDGLYGVWDGIGVRFWLANESTLHIMSDTPVDPAPADLSDLYAFCNAWNQDRLWPKVYVHMPDSDDDGRHGSVRVAGEVNFYLPHGVTVEQLRRLLQCGVGTNVHFFSALSERNS